MDTQTQCEPAKIPAGPRQLHRLNRAQVQLLLDKLNNRALNITKIAKDCDMSRATFYTITRGMSSTSPANLERIAKRLNIDPKILCS